MPCRWTTLDHPYTVIASRLEPSVPGPAAPGCSLAASGALRREAPSSPLSIRRSALDYLQMADIAVQNVPAHTEADWTRRPKLRHHSSTSGTLNLWRYVHGVPWIARAPGDAGQAGWYACHLCKKWADAPHLTSANHLKRAAQPAYYAGTEWEWWQPHAHGSDIGFTQNDCLPDNGLEPMDPEQARALQEVRPREHEHPGAAGRLERGGDQPRAAQGPLLAQGQALDRQLEAPPARAATGTAAGTAARRDNTPVARARPARTLLDQPYRRDEPRLRDTYAMEFERYAASLQSLHEQDHFSAYGPMLHSQDGWEAFVRVVQENGTGTTAMGVQLCLEAGPDPDLVVTWNPRWQVRRPERRAKWVVSRSHPLQDWVLTGDQVDWQQGQLRLKWKRTWGDSLSEWLERGEYPATEGTPEDHFRLDVEVDDINPSRVRRALELVTRSHGGPNLRGKVFTPLQVLLGVNDIGAATVELINDASAATFRMKDGFRSEGRGTPRCSICWEPLTAEGEGSPPTTYSCGHHFHRHCLDEWRSQLAAPEGPTSCPRCGQQKKPERDDGSQAASSSHKRAPVGTAGASDAKRGRWCRREGKEEEGGSDPQPEEEEPLEGAPDLAWARVLRHVAPPKQQTLLDVGQAMGLNASQKHAMVLTRQHYMVLAQGPPGTGKTKMAAATLLGWNQVLGEGEVILAAAPSHAAVDNLLDRVHQCCDGEHGVASESRSLGRLGEPLDPALPANRFSIAAQLGGGLDMTPGQRHSNNKRVKDAIRARWYRLLFGTYMKAADADIMPVSFALLDEAGQATEPDTLVALAPAILGGHVMLVGDEQQLPPTVTDPKAEWGGLAVPLFGRLQRAHREMAHVCMLEIQYRMHPDIQRFPSDQYYGQRLLFGGSRIPPEVEGFPWPQKRPMFTALDPDGRTGASAAQPLGPQRMVFCAL